MLARLLEGGIGDDRETPPEPGIPETPNSHRSSPVQDGSPAIVGSNRLPPRTLTTPSSSDTSMSTYDQPPPVLTSVFDSLSSTVTVNILRYAASQNAPPEVLGRLIGIASEAQFLVENQNAPSQYMTSVAPSSSYKQCLYTRLTSKDWPEEEWKKRRNATTKEMSR